SSQMDETISSSLDEIIPPIGFLLDGYVYGQKKFVRPSLTLYNLAPKRSLSGFVKLVFTANASFLCPAVSSIPEYLKDSPECKDWLQIKSNRGLALDRSPLHSTEAKITMSMHQALIGQTVYTIHPP
ncbi:hypothetical protein NPIL_639281, partial [Nephila pilipes]